MKGVTLASVASGCHPAPPPPRWIRVPLGAAAGRWRTLTTERTVLVVVRNATTLWWLLEICEQVLGDERIQVLFAVSPGSAYRDGVADLVRQEGGVVVPWDQATSERFDLAISASHYGDLHELDAPLLITSHGPGFNKRISVPADGRPPLPRDRRGRWRTTVLLGHASQGDYWSPGPEDRTVVGGDPCFDSLEAGLPYRDRFRAALGVSPGQHLVVISSTWGPGSLLSARPDLPADLLAALPADEWVVAAILHANIWVGHGPWQVRAWLSRARAAGLRLLPHRAGWRPALVAADFLIGDNGSVTFYGAALGVPTAVASFSEDEVVPESAVAELMARAPAWDAAADPVEQLTRLGSDRDPGRYADLVDRTFARRGEALRAHREIVFDLLSLNQPASAPRVLRAPDPVPEVQRVLAYIVTGRVIDPASGHVAVHRYPAVLDPEHTLAAAGRHMVVDSSEPEPRLLQCAAVLLHREAALDPQHWATRALSEHPGCTLAVAAGDAGRLVAAFRGGPCVDLAAAADADISLLASALYLLLLDGVQPEPGGGLRVRAGQAEATARITRRVLPAFD